MFATPIQALCSAKPADVGRLTVVSLAAFVLGQMCFFSAPKTPDNTNNKESLNPWATSQKKSYQSTLKMS